MCYKYKTRGKWEWVISEKSENNEMLALDRLESKR